MVEAVWSAINGHEGDAGFNEFEFPARDFAVLRKSSRRKTVCVVGGGIAGLIAAYELLGSSSERGHEVVLVEAGNRLGGRIRTWRTTDMYGNDIHGEFGPMRFPPNHAGTWHYVEELGLATAVFIQSNLNAWCQVGEFRCRRSDFGSLIAAYDNAYGTNLNRTWLLRGHHPQGSMTELLGEQLDLKFESKPRVADPMDEFAQAVDRVSLWQYLRDVDVSLRASKRNGGSKSVVHTYRRPGARPGRLSNELLTEDEYELLSRASGERWEEGMSALEIYTESYGIRGADRRTRLVDGMDALPRALEAEIRARHGRILLKTAVTAVIKEADGRCMRVFTGDEEITADDGRAFDYVICATPASATSRISFEPRLDRRKAAALSGLHYRNAAKSLVSVNRRVWEDENPPIFGGASYTDRLIQQCWYPSDNVWDVQDTGERSIPLEFVPGGGANGLGSYTTLEVAGDPNGWLRPAILTGAYMTGVNADRFISLSQAEKTEVVLSCLEDLHPGIRNDVRDIAHWEWIEESVAGGGAWAHFDPGERYRFQKPLNDPHPADSPKVFFAGEHICPLHGWMQSAIFSSIKATLDVLDAS